MSSDSNVVGGEAAPPRETVGIRPGVSMLSVLAALDYKVWHALAEYVDNALQSYVDHREDLVAINGPDSPLRVEIQVDRTRTPKAAPAATASPWTLLLRR